MSTSILDSPPVLLSLTLLLATHADLPAGNCRPHDQARPGRQSPQTLRRSAGYHRFVLNKVRQSDLGYYYSLLLWLLLRHTRKYRGDRCWSYAWAGSGPYLMTDFVDYILAVPGQVG